MEWSVTITDRDAGACLETHPAVRSRSLCGQRNIPVAFRGVHRILPVLIAKSIKDCLGKKNEGRSKVAAHSSLPMVTWPHVHSPSSVDQVGPNCKRKNERHLGACCVKDCCFKSHRRLAMNFSNDRGVGGAEKLMLEAADWLIEVLDRNFSGIHHNESTLIPNAEDDGLAGDDVDPFWSKEQLILIENFPANAFVVMGLIVSIIGILGLVANGMVLFIFSRFKRLRSPPANTFIINLALSDMSASILHSMAAYSNFNGRWAFGRLGCKFYAMGITCFGLVSILTFSAIACERCLVIGVSNSRFKVSRSQAKKACCFIWLHCAILVSMPFFGWSSYVPEGLLTTCSWDYKTRTVSNRAYYVLLLSAGFFLPLLVIFVSYGRIMTSVMSQARQMICINSQNSVLRKLRRQTEIRTAQIVVTLILVYLTAWTPYAIVTLIGQFGSKEYQLSPMATAIPAYFAKTAVVLDPLVYGFSHPHFRTSLKNYLSNLCGSRNMKIGSDIRPHNHNGGMSKCSSKSWPGGMPGNSSYQSRGMTVYPTSACCALRICEPHNCTRKNSSASAVGADNGQRRMLRTFRELSLHDVQQETNFGKISHGRRPSATTIDRQTSSRRSSQTQLDHHLFHQFKYKVRNAEFHSECCGPSTLVVAGAH